MVERHVGRRVLSGKSNRRGREDSENEGTHVARNLTCASGRGNGLVLAPMPPLLVLILAVLAVSYAGPAIRLTTAPAVAVAFWRLVLVLPVTFGFARRASWRALDRSTVLLMTLSGLLLAVHFWSWIASLRFTTVASSVLLVNLRPIFVWAIAAAWLHEQPGPRERWGIALAVLGATLIGVGDARLSLGAVGGDLLALAGAVTAAGYSVIGRRVRQTLDVWSYVTVVYGVAALALGVGATLLRSPLTGFASCDWAVFAALAAGPMLVGHTGMNYALKHFRATTVNVAGLGEPVGATLIAWLVPAIHEVPPLTALAGGVMVLLGIGLALTERRSA
jgi:drug/metabolite transporter (DMT)-like permease